MESIKNFVTWIIIIVGVIILICTLYYFRSIIFGFIVLFLVVVGVIALERDYSQPRNKQSDFDPEGNKINTQVLNESSRVLSLELKEKIKLFEGKTLAQVGEEFGLTDDDVSWVETSSGETELEVIIDGAKYLIPLKSYFPKERMDDPEYLLKCSFMLELKLLLARNGEIIKDENYTEVVFGNYFDNSIA